MNNKSPRWFFYPAWAAVNAIGIPIAATIASALDVQVVRVVGGTIQVAGQTRIAVQYLGPYIFIPLLGLMVGVLQYLLLRRCLPRMGWWVTATALGLLLGYIASRLLTNTVYSTFGATGFAILTTMLLGGSMGLAQWVVLRQRVRHAAWWIPAHLFSWAIVGWGAANLSYQTIVPAVGLLLVPGIATGIALWFLLDRLPRTERPIVSGLEQWK